MPRIEEQRIEGRKQYDIREFFGYTTPNLDVVARPTDPYVQPGLSSGAQNLINALGAVQTGLQGYAQYKGIKNTEDYEAGAIARAKGSPFSEVEKKSAATIKGWEELDGRITASTSYRNELAEYLELHKNDDPETFQKGLKEIAVKYLTGTDNYIKGFVDKGLAVDESVLASYQDYQNRKFVEELEVKVTGEMGNTIEEKLKAALSNTLGIEVADIREFIKSPQAFADYVESKDAFEKTIATALRSTLSEMQATYKDLGYNKLQVSEMFLDAVSTMAILNGIPELLSYAFEKDAQGNVSVAKTKLGDKVLNAIRQAENTRDSFLNAMNESAAKKQKEAENTVINGVRAQISELELIDDPLEAARQATALRLELMKNPAIMGMDSSKIGSFFNDLVKLENGQNRFPATGDEYAFAGLYAKATLKSLALEDIAKARKAGQLTLDQYTSLMDKWKVIEKEREDAKNGDKGKWQAQTSISQTQNSIIRMIAPMDMMGKIENPENEVLANHMFAQGLERWRKKNNNENPDFDQWYNEIAVPVIKFFEEKKKREGGDAAASTDVIDLTTQRGVQKQEAAIKQQEEAAAKQKAKEETAAAQQIKALNNLSSKDSYSRVEQSFNAGYNRTQITAALTKAGTTEESIKRYLSNYGRTYTKEFIRRMNALSRGYIAIETIEKQLREDLKAKGFNDNEIAYYWKEATKPEPRRR